MSVKAMAWAWKQELSPSTKLVLLALADHSDDTGLCWPGRRGIREKCSLSRATTNRALTTLTTQGLIDAEPRHRDDGSRATNVYRLHLEQGWAHRATGVGSQSDRGGLTVSPGGARNRHGSQSEDSAEPSREPSEEPTATATAAHAREEADNAFGPPTAFTQACRLYEDNIALLTPTSADALEAILADYPIEWFEAAVKEATASNVRNLKYIKAILDRWSRDGFQAPRQPVAAGQRSRRSPTPLPTADELAASWGVQSPEEQPA